MTISKFELVNMGCDSEHVEDWFQIRKDKRAPSLTKTALKRIINEAERAGLTIAEAIEACCEYEWRGFRADWYANKQPNGSLKQHNKQAVRDNLRDITNTNW